MLKNLKLPLIVFSGIVLASCASIVSNNLYPVRISTNPQEVAFKLYKETSYGNELISTGVTPQIIQLTAGGDHYFQKNRYLLQLLYHDHIYNTEIVPSIDGWYFGNMFLGGLGLVGFLVIDPITGNMFKLPEVFNYDLTVQEMGSLQIKTLNELTAQQKEHLVPLTSTKVLN